MDSDFGTAVFVVGGKQVRTIVAGELHKASAVHQDTLGRHSSVQWH